MNASQTFHTPSFGDEEFEIPTVGADHSYKYTEQSQSSTLTGSGYNAGVFGESAMGDISDEGANLDPKRKKPRDPNEPQKPVSAYALFFRDTQAAIKGQNPDASFGEVSKIVASMWDALDPEHKNVYKKKAEAAKREYLKSLAIYRANSLSRLEETNIRSAPDSDGAPPEKTAPSRSLLSAEGLKPSSFEGAPKQGSIATAPVKDSSNAPGILHAQSTSIPQAPQPVSMCQEQSLEGPPDPGLLQQCIRDGCTNLAIINSDWEDEYCSNECVVKHCRNVFAQWVQANALLPESYSSS